MRDNTGFDAELARKQACELVRLKRGMFQAYPDLDRDELVSFCLEKLLRDYRAGKYDPTKAGFGTWAWRVMSCDLLDLSRVRGRERARVHGVEVKPGYEGPAELEGEGGGETITDDDLAGWLGRIYRSVSGTINRYDPKPKGRGRPPVVTSAQRLALAALGRRQKLSTRGLVAVLVEREDLRRAVQIRVIPSQKTISRIFKKSESKFLFV